MKNRLITVITPLLILAVVLLLPAGPSLADTDEPARLIEPLEAAVVDGKDEVVYASLSEHGDVEAVYVVNSFHVLKGGQVSDFGDYLSAYNLTDTSEIEMKDDVVSFAADAGYFYYQGNMEQRSLPWLVNIDYELDGRMVEPEALGGADGQLAIHIGIDRNTGADSTFFEHYLVQVQATFDTENCEILSAPDAIIANAGQDKVVTMTALPGKSAKWSIHVSVKDFQMSGIQISAMPFAIAFEQPDTSGMIEDMNDLANAVADLNEGVLDFASGISSLNRGAVQLTEGSGAVQTGLVTLRDESVQLIQSSAQIRSSLNTISSSVQTGLGQVEFGMLAELPAGLRLTVQSLDDTEAGLLNLKDAFTAAYAALDTAILSIPSAEIGEDEISALAAGLVEPDQQATLNSLVEYYQAALTVKGTYGQVKPAFDAIGANLDQMATGLEQMGEALAGMAVGIENGLDAVKLSEDLDALGSGLSDLAAGYQVFDDGLGQYAAGIADAAGGYAAVHEGLADLTSGLDKLDNGSRELADGTSDLNDNVSDLPDQVQVEIDRMLAEYDKADFDPVSFVSSRNDRIGLVQFVFRTPDIRIDIPDDKTEDSSESLSFWDRLRALFSR